MRNSLRKRKKKSYEVKLMIKAADALGNPEDAARFRTLFDRIKTVFAREYVGADGQIKGGVQACYALAIGFNLLDEEKTKLAGKHLVKAIEARDWHLSTGIHGTRELMNALSKVGRNDVAFRLLHNDTCPSWGHFIKNGGTTIWERWNGWTAEKGLENGGMNSFNHYAFGSVNQWIVENIGGIRNAGLAYGKIVIAPQIDPQLTHAETRYDSIRGRIETRWRKQEKRLSLAVTIPPNTTATVCVPSAENAVITEGDRPADKSDGVKFLRKEPGVAVYSLQSGKYEFASSILP